MVFAQPVNDNCANASLITIGSGGYGLGSFNSTQIDISSATLQNGETFAPGILTAGLSKKSIWFKFTIATHRSAEVFLKQPAVNIKDGDVGFAIYKASTCLPGDGQISPKLTPIAKFASSKHPCLDPGEYLVQVSANTAAMGPVFISVELAEPSPAEFDKPSGAYAFPQFGNLKSQIKDFDVACQTIDNAAELCNSGPDFKNHTKSLWFTFTTPDYMDWLGVYLASHNYYMPPTKVSYRLYEGDGKNTPIANLNQIGGCDSLQLDRYYMDGKSYKCEALKTKTIYTIQLIFPSDCLERFRLGINFNGTAPANGPAPKTLTGLNNMGVLPGSPNYTSYTASDYMACNARHSQQNCPKTLLPAGFNWNNWNFNLSNFFSFTLPTAASVRVWPRIDYLGTNGGFYITLYKKKLTGNCNDLDSTDWYSKFLLTNYNYTDLNCLPAGDYVFQVSGSDTALPITSNYYGALYEAPYPSFSPHGMLGFPINLMLQVRNEIDINAFSLNGPGKIDALNIDAQVKMQPLVPFTEYKLAPDTTGCGNTVLPKDQICTDKYSKASYHQMVIADSGLLIKNSGSGLLTWKLYRGNANTLATAQNAFKWGDSIQGLTPATLCMANYYDALYACVTPDTFTLVGFDNRISIPQQSTVVLSNYKSKFGSPEKAQDMGDLWQKINYQDGGIVYGEGDYFTCVDNAVTIDGVEPCMSQYNVRSTKMIYRQFYLSQPAAITISTYIWPYSYAGLLTLFKGKATDGLNSLKKISQGYTCITSAGPATGCDYSEPGWYTVVAYGFGPSFQDPLVSAYQGYQSYTDLGKLNNFSITLRKGCAGPQFNRPYKASVDTLTQKPYLIKYVPQTGHTAVHPALGTTYTLNKENFNCTVDTPFYPKACAPDNYNKVAYYVFTTTQEAGVNIYTGNSDLFSALYDFDVRTKDSVKLKNIADTALHPCIKGNGFLQVCRLKPGTYTLLIFAPGSWTCNTITPQIYIDSIGYSRFDFAAKAYDFGAIPPDSAWHYGKKGDVNPLNKDRVPSYDFIFCTTGAAEKDVTENHYCSRKYSPYIYPSKPNTLPYPGQDRWPTGESARRNLWYTFTANHPGNLSVVVNGLFNSYDQQPDFAVYESDEDGTVPFNTLVAEGKVDSTFLQGLKLIAHNGYYYCWYRGYNQVTVYNEPCNFKPKRYYLVVDNHYDQLVNSQVFVRILLDSVTATPPKYDFYSKAYDFGQVNSGVKRGATDNLTCATRSLPDPNPNNCDKTLWYKFTTTTTGRINYRVFFDKPGYGDQYGDTYINLFRQLVPGDSTSAGLQYLPLTTSVYKDNKYWSQRCISPGTYYLMLPGCYAVNEDIYPEIEIIGQDGDFCSKPMVTAINGVGTKVVPVTIDCHTIGTDYGEFNQTLTCPANAPTVNYKTSWYRIDIGGSDVLDLTVYIDEKTNAGSTDIKYRMMTGTCGAMQEQSCVQDALTRNTYECMQPGNSYYIQVFTPVQIYGYPITGDIDLNISAVKHVGPCAPANNCIAVAEFFPKFDCTKDRNMSVTNLSTFGSDIKYEWDFGYNNQKSNAVSPEFFYPALTTDKTYTVTLKVTNLVCGKTDEISKTITIPARPGVNLGRDTIICTNGTPYILNAKSHTGSTYRWMNGSADSILNVPYNAAWSVEVSYKNCKAYDTVNVWVNPIAKRNLQTAVLCNIDQVSLQAARGQGESIQWNNGSIGSTLTVTKADTYWCDIYLNSCTVRDSFLVINPAASQQKKTVTVCQKNMPYAADATFSGASAYKWNDNNTNAKRNIATPGTWWVDITVSGCTIRDSLLVKVDSFKVQTSTARICSGQTFSLPSGKMVTTSGLHRDTLRNVRGCDSLIHNITLTVEMAAKDSSSAIFYAGQTYRLPWGKDVIAPGIYRDTLKSVKGCDSLYRIVNLRLLTVQITNTDEWICFGKTFILPWGKTVSATGIYADTIKSSTDADSLIKTVTLTVLPRAILTADTTVCEGVSFSLKTMTAKTYSWSPGTDLGNTNTGNPVFTARQNRTYTLATTSDFGGKTISCTDKVTISVLQPTLKSEQITLCQGQQLTLPSGRQVNATGLYRDTLRGATGCDSIITNLNLTIQNVVTQTLSAFICQGQTYLLPSGKTVSITGLHRDTLRYTTGCDSIITNVNLVRYDLSTQSLSATICLGNSYRLPSGRMVSAAGTHRDTLRYTTGCDSIRYTLSLAVRTVVSDVKNLTLCRGQQFTLPSGRQVNTTGLYRDTLRGATGCDSLITNLTLTIQDVVTQTLSAFICQGQTYRLPSGKTASATGQFRDTLRYTTGCDSIITNVNLVRYDVSTQSLSATICLGNSYRLPSGRLVNTAGTHRDTLRYAKGCDSIRYTLNLTVTDALRQSNTVHICTGQTFRLPSGRIVSAAGLYRDTVRTVQNCDSLISQITIVVHAATVQSLSPTICQGQMFTLPSGKTAGTAGLYQDTLRNIHGCDSIRFSINLSVTPRRFSSATVTLCAGQVFTRPSGKTATIAGTYTDTIRASTGCDSIITTTLLYRTSLVVRLAGPASVCTGVSATLTATASGGNGGPYSFSWTGATGSGNSVTVSPSATTKYVVTVSDGCTVAPARDSITITYVPPPQPGLNNATVTICRGSSANLSAVGGAAYLWSPSTGLSNTGIANPVASPVTDTRYRVRVTTATGCLGEDSILVKVTQPFTLTASLDTFVCAGGTVPLSASGAVRYEWAGTGLSVITGPSVTARPSATTTYTVTGLGNDNCFTQTKNIRVTVIPLPVVNAGRDTTIMVGTSIVLRPSYTGSNLQYNWTPATYLNCTTCATPAASPREPMEYTILVKNTFGCTSSDQLRVELKCNAESIFLPNTFTPNGDGSNDIWYPRGGGIKTVRYLKVFNRWGQLIFERSNFNTDDRSAGWDGTFQGQPLPPDVFVYSLGTVCDNGQNLETKGNVMIVR